MTLDELITDLKAAGANENTIRLAMNCYNLGYEDGNKAAMNASWSRKHWTEYEHDLVKAERNRLADELQKMPLNDTANSIAMWIRGQE